MKKKLLITRPEHDDTTHFLSNWSKKALGVALSKGIVVLDLNQERANKKQFEGMLFKQRPCLVILNGHGGADTVTGHKNQILLAAGKNEQCLKETITYAISCRSAEILGPLSVKAGAKAYIGYDDDFIFFYEPNMITRPLDDYTAKLFLEPSTELMTSLFKGNSAEESWRRSQEHFKSNIKKLLSSEATPEQTTMARYVWWDMKHQVLVGNGKAVF